MQTFEVFFCCFFVRHAQFFTFEEEIPEAAQEAGAAVHAVRVPRFTLIDRPKKHFVEAQGICTIFIDNVVRIYHIEHRLRHLFDSPTADIFAIFQNKFSCAVFRTPRLKGFDIQDVVRHDIHVNVNRRHFILIFQTKTHKRVGVFYTINEVGTALDHPLIDHLLKGFVFARCAQIEEELIPESTVYEVTRSVLTTAHVEVYTAPIVVGFLAYESRRVRRIHIAKIVGRTSCKAGHRTEF